MSKIVLATAPFELVIERYIDAPPEAVYKVWTGRLVEWWCPRPWTTEIIENDMRPGGRCAMVMRGPADEKSDMEGVYLEIVPNERIVFTNAFTSGWVPQAPFMLGYFDLAPEGRGTRYRAGSRHWDEATQEQHAQMGFTEGWTKVADQLAELVEGKA